MSNFWYLTVHRTAVCLAVFSIFFFLIKFSHHLLSITQTHSSFSHPSDTPFVPSCTCVSLYMHAHIFGLWRELLPRCFVVSESVWEHTHPELWVVGGKQMWIVIFLPFSFQLAQKYPTNLKTACKHCCCLQVCAVLLSYWFFFTIWHTKLI